MTTTLAKTSLHDWHAAHGARMVDFAGWSMPVQYTSIVAEHTATRTAVGLFDISHMGRLRVGGADAGRFLDALVTRRVVDLEPGQIRYALVCDERGGILDDVLVYRLPEEGQAASDGATHQVVVNASNRTKIVDWFAAQRGRFDVSIDDATPQTAMIAVQGPRAVPLVDSLVSLTEGRKIGDLKYYTSASATFDGRPISISRTGYTGEDGCEIIAQADDATTIWEKVLGEGEALGARPVGLGARDTLRLEAAMPLYGHELSEEIDPIKAGLAFAVNLKDREFLGREAIARIKSQGNVPVRVGLTLEGKRAAREGARLFAVEDSSGTSDAPIGAVTSGTFSPTLERSIAMGYVAPEFQAPGTRLAADIRGTRHPCVVVPLPFYQRSKTG